MTNIKLNGLIKKLLDKSTSIDNDTLSLEMNNERVDIKDVLKEYVDNLVKDNQELENFNYDKTKIDNLIDALVYCKNWYSIIFDDRYLSYKEGKPSLFSSLSEIYETNTFASIEKAWSIFTSLFVTDNIRQLYKKYSYNNVDNKNFGIFELNYLVNNLYVIEIKGNSLKETWDFFTKGQVWCWFKEIKTNRNKQMHATFTKRNVSKEENEKKFLNVVILYCMFLYLVERLKTNLIKSPLAEKFYLFSEPKPSYSIIKKTVIDYSQKHLSTVFNENENAIEIFTKIFEICKFYNNTKNRKETSYMINNWNSIYDAYKAAHKSKPIFNNYFLTLLSLIKIDPSLEIANIHTFLDQVRAVIIDKDITSANNITSFKLNLYDVLKSNSLRNNYDSLLEIAKKIKANNNIVSSEVFDKLTKDIEIASKQKVDSSDSEYNEELE